MKTALLKKPPVSPRSAANREAVNKNAITPGNNQSQGNSPSVQPVQFTLTDAKRYIKRTLNDYNYPWDYVPVKSEILQHIHDEGVNWKRIEREYDKEPKKEKKEKKKSSKKKRAKTDVSSEESTKSPKKKQKTTHYTQQDQVVDDPPKKKKKRKVQDDTKTKKQKTEKKSEDTEVKSKSKTPVKRKIEALGSDTDEKETQSPPKKFKPKEKKKKKEEKDIGPLPSVEEAMLALKAKTLPDEIDSWAQVQKAIEQGVDTEDFGSLLKRLVTIIYGYSSKANQYKFPPNSAEKKISNEYGEGLREVIAPRNYKSEDDKVLQQLRWISTALYNYIKSLKKPLEEVQTLWDGEFLHITENSLTNNTEIISLLNNKDDFMKFLGKYSGKEESKDRFDRHPAELLEALKGDDEIGPINALSTHLSSPKKSKLNVPDTSTVSEQTPRKMHAEIRLGINYLNKKAPKKQKEDATKIWVAGVKRPCFACFVRLSVLKELYSEEQIDLIHNPHKGLLWPSGPAWTGATTDDKIRALQELGLSAYIEGLESGNKEAMEEHVRERKISLTQGKGKVGQYDKDTDSEHSD